MIDELKQDAEQRMSKALMHWAVPLIKFAPAGHTQAFWMALRGLLRCGHAAEPGRFYCH